MSAASLSPGLQRRARSETIRVATVMIAVAGITAALTRLMFARAARGLLRVHFTTVAVTPAEAFSIFAHNALKLVGIAAVLFAVAGFRALRAADGIGSRAERVFIWGYDVIIAGSASFQVVLLGMALGGYGQRQLGELMPYAPVEFAAWALALGLYLRARKEPVSAREAARALTIALVLLAFAAVLELWEGRL
jgi:hypothetical protein